MSKRYRVNKILGAMVVVVMVLVPIAFFVSWQFWAQFQSMLGEEFISRVGASSGGIETQSYRLVDGWNFIAFPFEPTTVKSASELIKDVGDAGGMVTMVSRWNGDRWQEFAKRGEDFYGDDFSLVPGQAYFVRNHAAVTWEAAGLPIAKTGEYGVVTLKPGWNAVGLTPVAVTSARALLDKANFDGVERANEVDHWYSGNWQSLVKRWYSASNIQEYGDNFDLSKAAGYMIRAYEPISIKMTE